jgi:hypothetical protein
MRIDKTRQQNSATGIDHFAVRSYESIDRIAGSNLMDPIAAHKHGSVIYD